MGIAWGTLTFVVLLLYCGGIVVLGYSIAKEYLSLKKRIRLAAVAVAAMAIGLMVQDAKVRIDERIASLELKVWLHEQGTAKKLIEALEKK